jgi:hypothetical protein
VNQAKAKEAKINGTQSIVMSTCAIIGCPSKLDPFKDAMAE